MVGTSTMHVNPDIPEAHALRGWFDSTGKQESFQSYTGSMSSSSAVKFDRAEIRNLNDVKTSELGLNDKEETFCARATVMHIKNENISYPAPNPRNSFPSESDPTTGAKSLAASPSL